MRLRLLALLIGFLLLARWNPIGLPFVPGEPFSDSATSHWPATTYTRATVLNGDYPLWRDAFLAGGPFAANPLNKTAYPLQWPALVFPAALHLNILLLAHWLLAGWGMWHWSRSLGMTEAGAAFAAMVYMLAPKFVAHIGAGHVDIVYALAWWPWLMWLLAHGHDRRSGLAYVLKLGLVAAMLVLADVRVSLFAFGTAAVYAGWLSVRDRQPIRILQAAVAVIPFSFLIVAMLVPLLSWQPYLSRSSITAAGAGQLSVEPLGLVGLLLPIHEGNVEVLVYIGLSVLVLAIIGLFARRDWPLWVGLLLFAIFYALGPNSPLWTGLVGVFPPLLWFRVPARAWFVVMLVVAPLAGAGVQALTAFATQFDAEAPPKGLFWLRLAAMGGAGIGLVCGGLTLAMLDLPSSSGLALMIVGGFTGGVIWLALLGRIRGRWLVALLFAVTYVDLAWTGVNWAEWRGQGEWLAPHEPLAERLLEDSPSRVYAPAYALPQEASAAFDIPLFHGIDPFQITGIVVAIEQGSGVSIDEYSVVLPPLRGIEDDDEVLLANQDAVPDAGVLAEWGVSHLISAYPLEGFEQIGEVDAIRIYTVPPADVERSSLTGWPVNWDGLPSDETVLRLHQRTLLSVWVSAISFVLVGVIITFLEVRGRHEP